MIAESDLEDADNGNRADLFWQIEGRDPSPEFAAIMAEECRRLLDSLGDESLRKVALLKVDGYTEEEIAAQLDCSSRTIARKRDLIQDMWAGELS